jgi:hypothetical protein
MELHSIFKIVNENGKNKMSSLYLYNMEARRESKFDFAERSIPTAMATLSEGTNLRMA